MLYELRLGNFGIFKEVDVVFSPNLNVIVGETGAGKSLLLNSLEFLAGKRFSFETEGTFAEAVFDDETIVRREIVSKRARSFLNGVRVKSDVLANFIADRVSFQSQRESMRLFKPSYQLALLDKFAQNEKLLSEFSSLYSKYKELESKLSQLKAKEAERERLLDILRFQRQEILSAQPFGQEVEEELEQKEKLLRRSEEISNLKDELLFELYESADSVYEKLAKFAEKLDELGFSKLSSQLYEAHYLVESVCDDVKDELDVEHLPESLEEVNLRLSQLQKVKRKYGGSWQEVEKFLSRIESQLAELESLDTSLTELQSELEALKRKLNDLAQRLHQRRKKAAHDFERKVLKSLRELEVFGTFKVEISQLPEISSKGKDKVTFLFSGSSDLKLTSLSSSISGGELSRLLLSVFSVVGDSSQLLIFDEVDAGMSGKTIKSVARKLKEISKKTQVIVVTHSPVVASAADRLFFVQRQDSDAKITQVKEPDVVLANMIAGRITEGALKTARELLEEMR